MESNERQAILKVLSGFSTPDRPVYLVGGAVRDMLLDHPAHDLDFTLPGNTRSLAQEVACQLEGVLYRLDEERDTTRVILEATPTRPERMLLDFATLRGSDLEADLRDRDFTINAMAVDVAKPEQLIDPTGGLSDLREKRIRACSSGSLEHDPVRILRAIRQALSFGFHIDPDTLKLMRAALPLLAKPSIERLRDELFRMLDGSRVSLAVRLMDEVGALAYVLPELEILKGVKQSPPHVTDVWNHTLSTVKFLEQLLPPLTGTYDHEMAADMTIGTAVLWLGRYRQQFAEHFNHRLVAERNLRALLFIAALYHDIGKPKTRVEMPEGRVRFLEHETWGVKIAGHRARALALSSAETSRLETIIEHHMRVHHLAEVARRGSENSSEFMPSRRAIYRFFKDTGDAGVDICLLSLADLRATYGVTLPQDVWEAELRVVRALLEAYWEKSAEVVSPPRYLSGDDLIQVFNLKPGRDIGHLLSAIREAQAAGEIQDRAEAIEFSRHWLENHIGVEEQSRQEGEGKVNGDEPR